MGYGLLNTVTKNGQYPILLGYTTGARLGRVAQMRGLGAELRQKFLGDVSQELVDGALAQGMDQRTINTLEALGATDADFADLVQGYIDVPGLMQKLTGGAPGVSDVQMNYEPIDWATYGIESALDSLDGDVRTLESLSSSDPKVNLAVGSQVAAERAQVNQWRSKYQSWVNQAQHPVVYTLPDGQVMIGDMTEAGVSPYVVITAAAAAALLAAVVYYHQQTVNATMAQALASQTQAQTAGSAITQASTLNQQANAAAAAGNASQAAALRAQAAAVLATGTPAGAVLTDWSSWFQRNAVWIGAGIVAVLIAPSLIKKI